MNNSRRIKNRLNFLGETIGREQSLGAKARVME